MIHQPPPRSPRVVLDCVVAGFRSPFEVRSGHPTQIAVAEIHHVPWQIVTRPPLAPDSGVDTVPGDRREQQLATRLQDTTDLSDDMERIVQVLEYEAGDDHVEQIVAGFRKMLEAKPGKIKERKFLMEPKAEMVWTQGKE